MYSLPYFKEADQAVVLQFMQENAFVFLAGCDANNRPVATQVPLLIAERDGKLYLEGHIMRNTDHHKAFDHNKEVLAVFTGPHSYVSASWYQQPQVASTWNYMSVHARGTLTFLNEEKLVDILRKTTNHFENNQASPASFGHIPKDYVERLSKAIIGFEIEVTAIDHTFKLSQNRGKEDYKNIVHQLSVTDDAGAKGIAEQMEKGFDKLFGA